MHLSYYEVDSIPWAQRHGMHEKQYLFDIVAELKWPNGYRALGVYVLRASLFEVVSA